MAFRGVRSSWLITARNSLLERLAASAAARAWMLSVTSTPCTNTPERVPSGSAIAWKTKWR
jgi:hypothetical protein